MNTALTIQPNKSNSHAKLWKQFTNNVIEYLSDNGYNIIFLLLGKFAHSKEILINVEKHKIIKKTHPSPLSAHTGFFNSNTFIEIDDALKSYNKETVNWSID